MISFACPSCGRKHILPDALAGRPARCVCGTTSTVPKAGTRLELASGTGGAWRDRRLRADGEELALRFHPGRPIRLTRREGDPPESFVLTIDLQTGPLTMRVDLSGEYPRVAPRCVMLGPVFHPNVDSSGVVCVGDHWSAGERLSDLIIRIAEMLAFQSYNIRSPLNAEAAMWADLNASKLPLDSRDFNELCPLG